MLLFLHFYDVGFFFPFNSSEIRVHTIAVGSDLPAAKQRSKL